MTKEKFAQLQQDQIQSGMNMKMYLKHIGTSYSTYYYWRKKYMQEEPAHNLAPITFKPSPSDTTSFTTGQQHCGVTLLFPNGLRAHFGCDMEDLLMELLNKSLSGHVLP